MSSRSLNTETAMQLQQKAGKENVTAASSMERMFDHGGQGGTFQTHLRDRRALRNLRKYVAWGAASTSRRRAEKPCRCAVQYSSVPRRAF